MEVSGQLEAQAALSPAPIGEETACVPEPVTTNTHTHTHTHTHTAFHFINPCKPIGFGHETCLSDLTDFNSHTQDKHIHLRC